MRALLAICAFCIAHGATAAETAAQKKARLELEAELNSMVKIPPPFAHVQYFGFDEGSYEVTEYAFVLDGKPLPKVKPEVLKEFGANTIYRGEVSHGDHELVATVSYTDGSSMMFSENAGYTWQLKTKVTFTAQRGLETRILLTPSRDGSKERNRQFALSSKVTPIMIAQLDDGTIVERKKAPEPTPEPVPEKVETAVVDAGAPSAAIADITPVVVPVAGEEKPVDTKPAVFRPAPVQTAVKPVETAQVQLTAQDEVARSERTTDEIAAVPTVQQGNDAGVADTAAPVAEQPAVEAPASYFGLVFGLLGGAVALGALIFVARRRANRFEKIDP